MSQWKEIIAQEQEKPYYQKLKQAIDKRYKTTQVYPPKEKIFAAFSLCEYEKLKVVILGQDPYHNPDQAQGLAFSTPAAIKNPPSMQNILKEIAQDVGQSQCENGDLRPWARQGVLLFNTILTVEHNKPKSHHKLGWETLSDNIIQYINAHKKGVVFLLWGAHAIEKKKLIDTQKHHVLTASHPSPLSAYRGFFGCKHFSKTNEILEQMDKDPIIW